MTRQRTENGLPEDKPLFPDDTLRRLINEYTREAGVRNLEREIGTICRKVARRFAEGKPVLARIRPAQVPEFLGPPALPPSSG